MYTINKSPLSHDNNVGAIVFQSFWHLDGRKNGAGFGYRIVFFCEKHIDKSPVVEAFAASIFEV